MVHELLIGEGREADIEEVFGASGIWRGLLKRSQGFLTSELSCESATERLYRLHDLWTSHLEFETFREKYSVEFDRVKQLLIAEGLLEKQVWLGSFYIYGDPGNETQLAPA